MMICSNCRKANNNSAAYCIYCGAALSQNELSEKHSRLKGGLIKGSARPPAEYSVKEDRTNTGKTGAHEPTAKQNGRLKGTLSASDSIDSSYESVSASPETDFHSQRVKTRISEHHTITQEAKNMEIPVYCKRCGRKLLNGELCCPYCDSHSKEGIPNHRESSRKWWIPIISVGTLVFLIIGITLWASRDKSNDTVSTIAAERDPMVTAAVSTPKQTNQPSTPTPTNPTPVSPTPAATTQPGPSSKDLQGSDSRIVQPNTAAWLADYEIRYVQSSGGVSIYLRYGPSADYDYFDTVKEAEAVTVLADQNGFSLVLASGNRIGWCKSALIVTENNKITPVPSFNETYWSYSHGQTLAANYACLFHANGTYSAYDYGGGAYSEGTYSIEGRRLKLDGVKLLWDGTRFVSTEKYEMQVGSDYYTLTADPTAYYEEIKATVNSWSMDHVTSSSPANTNLADGEYYVELINEEYWGDHDFITVDLLRVIGIAPSDNLIFENTNESFTIMVSNNCTIRDSSLFDDYGLTEAYYSSISPIIAEYGFGTILYIKIQNGEATLVDKFYIA